MTEKTYAVEMSVPRGRDWCRETRDSLAGWRRRMERSPEVAAACILPDVAIADHDPDLSSLEFSFGLSAPSGRVAIERAYMVLDLARRGSPSARR